MALLNGCRIKQMPIEAIILLIAMAVFAIFWTWAVWSRDNMID